VCINLELQFASRPLIVISFDCIRVGVDGVGIEKPSTSHVVSPDPIRGKHLKTIIRFQSHSHHLQTYHKNFGWNEWSQKKLIVIKVKLPTTRKGYCNRKWIHKVISALCIFSTEPWQPSNYSKWLRLNNRRIWVGVLVGTRISLSRPALGTSHDPINWVPSLFPWG
jgi:hypothetical protein